MISTDIEKSHNNTSNAIPRLHIKNLKKEGFRYENTENHFKGAYPAAYALLSKYLR